MKERICFQLEEFVVTVSRAKVGTETGVTDGRNVGSMEGFKVGGLVGLFDGFTGEGTVVGRRVGSLENEIGGEVSGSCVGKIEIYEGA